MAQIGARTARRRVFEIPELAEGIFLHIGYYDLLLNVQRTCKLWQQMVLGNPATRQILFLSPITTKSVGYKVSKKTWFDEDGKTGTLSPIRHPFMTKFMNCLWDEGLDACLMKVEWWQAEASWRQALISQPPIKTYMVPIKKHRFRGVTVEAQRVRVEGTGAGVTIGDLEPYMNRIDHTKFSMGACGHETVQNWRERDQFLRSGSGRKDWKNYTGDYQQLKEVQEQVQAFEKVD